jgi:secreted protein with Ig-like and vWFA domain
MKAWSRSQQRSRERHALLPALCLVLLPACRAEPSVTPPPRAVVALGPTAASALVAVAPGPTADPDPEPAEKCQTPALALSIVISRSASMTGRPLEEAKAAAREAAEHVAANDMISIIAFDSKPLHVSRLVTGRDRRAVVASIARISPGSGTDIFLALDMALQDLDSVVSARKHVLLVTDRTSPTQGIREVVQVMVAASITVSAIGLGSSIDEDLLESIAHEGGGRFYTVAGPTDLRAAFASDLDAVRDEPER